MRIIVIVSILLSAILIADCNKPMDPLPNPCEIEPCDTSEPKLMMGPHEILWIAPVNPDTSYGINKDLFLTPYGICMNSLLSENSEISMFSKEGNILWEWNDLKADYVMARFDNKRELILNKTWNYRITIDAKIGQTIESIRSDETSNPRGFLTEDYLYFDEYNNNETEAILLRAPIDDLSKVDTIYKLRNEIAPGARKSIESLNNWLEPASDNEFIVFQHRMAKPNRVDVIGYNVTLDSIVWQHLNIEPNGSSSTSQILIVEDRAYFQGLNTLYCFDIPTGEILWQQRYLDPDKRGFAYSKLTYIEEEELLIIKDDGESVMAFDALIGYEEWDQDRNAGTNGNEGDYYKGVFYYTASGALHAVDIRNGRMIWYEKSRLHQHSVLDGPVVIDKENGVLYASDRRYLIAVDLESGD